MVKISDAEIVACYQECMSAYKAAELLGINWKTVYNALARSGIAANGLVHYRQNAQAYSPEIQQEMLRLYNSGVRTPELARRFGGSRSSVGQAILRNGGKLKKAPGNIAKISPEQEREICDKYKAGMSSVALATITHHSQPIICAVLKRNGVQLRRRRTNKIRYRYVGTQGYVYLRVEPDDPMIVMCNTKGMVAEHRLVMARKLGRPLLPTETVHHIDGDKLNNAPDNLQLRQGKHGKHIAMCCLDCGSQNIGPIELT